MGAVIPDASIILDSCMTKLRQTEVRKTMGHLSSLICLQAIYDVRVTHFGFKPQARCRCEDRQRPEFDVMEITLQVGLTACDAEPVVTYEARVGGVNLVGGALETSGRVL